MASQMMAESVGERVRQAVSDHKFSVRAGKSVQVGISIGIACFPNDGETTEELLTAAARNMQNDKHSRKNLQNLATMPTPARIDHYT
jgi:diguanylate cyclase (GGDEF)-like protein